MGEQRGEDELINVITQRLGRMGYQEPFTFFDYVKRAAKVTVQMGQPYGEFELDLDTGELVRVWGEAP